MNNTYCNTCWQEKQHCQCGNNVNKPQWVEWECPVCNELDSDCVCGDNNEHEQT